MDISDAPLFPTDDLPVTDNADGRGGGSGWPTALVPYESSAGTPGDEAEAAEENPQCETPGNEAEAAEENPQRETPGNKAEAAEENA